MIKLPTKQLCSCKTKYLLQQIIIYLLKINFENKYLHSENLQLDLKNYGITAIEEKDEILQVFI